MSKSLSYQLILCIIVLTFTRTAICQDKIVNKEEYLKNIQVANSDFDCLKKCIRPPSVNMMVEPTQSEKDPRPTASNCNDRPLPEDYKKTVTVSPLIQIDDGKYYFPKTPQSVTWHTAWRTCRASNLQLVSIITENLAKKFGDAMFKEKMTGQYWSSGYVLSSGEMVWSETGNPVMWGTLMTGAPGPKKAPNTCIFINYDVGAKKLKLNEENCAKTLSYICEVPDEWFTHKCY